ncbi:type II toxin-antitoxin system HigB family toxin [Dyadobacter sp. CY261]|uniref:type II toxin-antitoxin system HigB family toxin n=1 Tax=Dyadobacter sp. CY261 TaxID=2907203 RepID=UPI002104E799|nr:type II toxin-antitoxin system HigB family toxin [Dyadobacter sp. CY261]
MVIFTDSTLRHFIFKYPDADQALNTWARTMKKKNFRTFHELKHCFNSVDSIGDDLFVFNIKGNKYRLIARIHFPVRTLYIRFIGTHKQYDNVNVQSL